VPGRLLILLLGALKGMVVHKLETALRAMAVITMSLLLLLATPISAQSVLDPSCSSYTGSNIPEVCKSNDDTSGDTAQDSGVTDFVVEVIDILLIGIGVIAVFMLIVGAVKYMLSTGDSAKLASARSTIIYALIGIGVAVFARAIVLFVIETI